MKVQDKGGRHKTERDDIAFERGETTKQDTPNRTSRAIKECAETAWTCAKKEAEIES